MAGIGIIASGNFGPTGMATGEAKARNLFVEGATNAFVFDPLYISTLFQDRAGTVPVTAAGQPVRHIKDRSGQNRHAIAAVAEPSGPPVLREVGGKRWVEVPSGASFNVENPITHTDFTVVGAVQIASSAVSSQNIVKQVGTHGSAFLLMQIVRTAGEIRQNLLSTAGFELVGPAMSGDAPHTFIATKNVLDPNASIGGLRLDGSAMTTMSYIRPPGITELQSTTELMATATGTGPMRLYYMAFVSAIRDYAALEAVAANRI